MISLSTFKSLHRSSWRQIAGALVASVFMAGCGGGSDDSSSSSAADATVADALSQTTSDSRTTSTSTGRSKAAAASWVLCAGETGTCSFSGSREVRYGTASSNIVKVLNGPVACTNGVFGRDPAFGVTKQCWYGSDTASAPASSTPVAATGWSWCAQESGNCSFSGTRTVRYGTTSSSVSKNLTNGTSCNNGVFGDPAPGQTKTCWVAGGTTTAPVATTPVATTPSGGGFSRTQLFPLRDQYVSGQPGQYTNLKIRVYGVPMGTNTKVFAHFYNGSTRVGGGGHHLRYLPSASWNGYLQYDHPIYVPTNMPVGTFRISIGFYQYVAPWTVMMYAVQGNGVSQIYTNSENIGYHVGYITVNPATTWAAVDQTSGAFLQASQSGWN